MKCHSCGVCLCYASRLFAAYARSVRASLCESAMFHGCGIRKDHYIRKDLTTRIVRSTLFPPVSIHCRRFQIWPMRDQNTYSGPIKTPTLALWLGGFRIQPTFALVRVVRGDLSLDINCPIPPAQCMLGLLACSEAFEF